MATPTTTNDPILIAVFELLDQAEKAWPAPLINPKRLAAIIDAIHEATDQLNAAEAD